MEVLVLAHNLYLVGQTLAPLIIVCPKARCFSGIEKFMGILFMMQKKRSTSFPDNISFTRIYAMFIAIDNTFSIWF